MKTDYPAHPAAEIFPAIGIEAFASLVEDIRAHGLREPIVLHEGKILDGRNRLRACTESKVEPRFRDFDGDDPIAFVVSLNLHRRHLDESQRAMVAARVATLRDGQRKSAAPIGAAHDTQDEAAGLLNVGRRSVQRARTVQERGAPELVGAVERGEVSVSAAAEVAKLPKAEQKKVVAEGRATKVAGEARRAKAAIRTFQPPVDDVAEEPLAPAKPLSGFDDMGVQLTESQRTYFAKVVAASRDVLKHLRAARKLVKETDGHGFDQSFTSSLDALIESAKSGAPCCICPVCKWHDRLSKVCKFCLGKAWVNEQERDVIFAEHAALGDREDPKVLVGSKVRRLAEL